jgi:hypothetical protein
MEIAALCGTNLFLFRQVWSHGLHSVAALDHVRLERDGPRATVELEKETAGVAEHGAHLVAAP